MVLEAKEMYSHYSEAVWPSHALPAGYLQIPGHLIKSSLFNKTHSHISKFNVAFILNNVPHYWHLLVAGAVECFKLPDLHLALGDYFGNSKMTYVCCSPQS